MDKSQNYFKRRGMVCRKGLISLLTCLICIFSKKKEGIKINQKTSVSEANSWPFLPSPQSACCSRAAWIKCIDLGVKELGPSPKSLTGPPLFLDKHHYFLRSWL